VEDATVSCTEEKPLTMSNLHNGGMRSIEVHRQLRHLRREVFRKDLCVSQLPNRNCKGEAFVLAIDYRDGNTASACGGVIRWCSQVISIRSGCRE
jgi:hypothetical protein